MYRVFVTSAGARETFDVFAVVAQAQPPLVNSRFGHHFDVNDPSVLDMARKSGIAWERALWAPHYTQWRVVEPERGKFRFTSIETGTRAGIQMPGSIMSTPQWAAPGDSFLKGGWQGDPYAMAMPDNLEDWRQYARATVRAYPQITHWEIFNEPHVGIFWNGKPDDLMTLFVEAAKVIKTERPNAKIVARPQPSLEVMHERGALQYVSALSEHHYWHGGVIDERIDTVGNIMRDLRRRLNDLAYPKSKSGTPNTVRATWLLIAASTGNTISKRLWNTSSSIRFRS